MRKRIRACGIAAVLAATAGAPAALAQEPIKIGAVGPMTGGAAGNGQSAREAIDLVIEEVNAGGGALFDKNGDPTFATHVVKIVGGKETNARQ